MTDDTNSENVESTEVTDATLLALPSSNYKTRGKQDAQDGTGVLGYNTATTGTAHGVEGFVDSPQPQAVGVYGEVTSTSNSGRGVKGVSQGSLGVGVAGRAPNGGTGVLANAGSGGNAIIANAPVTINDVLKTKTVDTRGNEFSVLAGTTSTGGARNVVLGHAQNEVTDGAIGATIGGGGFNDGNTDNQNDAHDNYATVGGGVDNQAGSPGDDDPATAQWATVGGGRKNVASAQKSTVAGGELNDATGGGSTVAGGIFNVASGDTATVGGGDGNAATAPAATVAGGLGCEASGKNAAVPGGFDNKAQGGESWAGGQWATAADAHAYVWNDGTKYHDTDNDGTKDALSSAKDLDGSGVTGSNTFHASATGGFRFITGSASSPNVTYIPGDSAGWTTASSRALKTNISPVDPEGALAGVDSLEVATWEYESEDGEGEGTTHIGPMAEEFHDAFDVGSSDEHINSINADGVAFAAIQGLSKNLDDTRETIAEKDERIDELEEQTELLRAENRQLRERNEELEARLDRLEAAVGIDSSDAMGVADD